MVRQVERQKKNRRRDRCERKNKLNITTYTYHTHSVRKCNSHLITCCIHMKKNTVITFPDKSAYRMILICNKVKVDESRSTIVFRLLLPPERGGPSRARGGPWSRENLHELDRKTMLGEQQARRGKQAYQGDKWPNVKETLCYARQGLGNKIAR